MRVWKPSLQSLFGLLAGAQREPREIDDALAEIQDAMLQALGPRGPKDFPTVARRIMYAADLQALWYLRGELMAALSALHGEAQARDTLQVISDQFDGMLPRGMSTRPSPLGK